MARRRKGKRKGAKRRGRRGGKRRGGKLSGHKFGIAESLGMVKTGLDMAGGATGANIKSTVKNPTWANLKYTGEHAWAEVKQKGSPLIMGVIVSNADKLPFVGKMLRGPKHKLDAIAKKWFGMRL